MMYITATTAIGREAKRKLNGPLMLLKWDGYKSPIKMGSPYEMYSPIVAIEVAAENATAEPREGMASKKARNAARQMVRIGAANFKLTLLKKRGRPRSRANPNIILEFEVIEKSPACQTQTIISCPTIWSQHFHPSTKFGVSRIQGKYESLQD